MIKLMTAAALAISAGAGVAIAQEGPRIEADLTRVEAQAKAGAMFEKLDLNHDGKLDQADRALRVQRRFDAIDTDHNGQISREEFAARRGPRPPQGRPGGPDGMAPAPSSPSPPRPSDSNPGASRHHGEHGHGPGPGAGPDRRMGGPRHDAAITRDAFVAGALKRFDATDADHNGTVTGAERQSARKAMRGKWQARHGGKPGDTPPPPAPPPPAG